MLIILGKTALNSGVSAVLLSKADFQDSEETVTSRMLFPTSAQDSSRGLPDANDLCLGLQSLSLTGWDRPWSTQDSDSSAQSSTHSGECQKMSWLGEGDAWGGEQRHPQQQLFSSPLHHLPPPPPIQHGAVLQEMEMLAVSVAGQMVARKGRHGFSTYPDKFPGVVSVHLGWP